MNNTISTSQYTTTIKSHAAHASVKSSIPTKRLKATLTLVPCKKRRGSRELGQAYGGRLECAGHSIWLEDATTLGVMAYVMNIGTVELRLPTLGDQALKLYAHQQQIPREVRALYSGVGKNEHQWRDEMSEALFAIRFASGLRVCTQSERQVPSLVDWYAATWLPQALNALPAELHRNTSLKRGN